MYPPKFSGITKDEFKQLKYLGIDKIVFDYQAYEQDTDTYLMGRNTHLHTCLLDSLLYASSVGIDTDVHFVPMKPNYQEIGDILEMLEIAGINQISILNFVPQGRGLIHADKLKLKDYELEEFMRLLHVYEKNFSGRIRIGIPLLSDNQHMCTAGLEKLDIKYDGTILPCPAFKELNVEIMGKYGIQTYHIHKNLGEVILHGGCRVEPLCQKVYKR